LNNVKQEITQHYKVLLAANDTSSICECDCGAIHLSFGPVVLNLSREEFLQMADLSAAASRYLRSQSPAQQLTADNFHGRTH
jgi:hypothetical protein